MWKRDRPASGRRKGCTVVSGACRKEVVLAKKAKSKRKPNAAFMKPLHPSAKLAEVVGEKALPRTEVTKKLWAYVKRKRLAKR